MRPCLELPESRLQGSCFMCLIAASGECGFSGLKRTTTPSIASWSRRYVSRRCVFVHTVGCRTIGTSSCGPSATATFPGSCNGWPTCTHNAGNGPNFALAMGTCIKGGSSHFPSKAMNISTAWCDTWSGTHCEPDSFSARRTGNGEVCTNVHSRHMGRCCAIGLCRNRPIGRNTSTCLRRKRSLRPSADAFVAAAPSAIPSGPRRQRSNSGCNQHSVVEVALTKNIHELSNKRILPNICACPLYFFRSIPRISPLPKPIDLTPKPYIRPSYNDPFSTN